ncbi:uncharacterized protein LOC110985056 [Acanthaster planci]|uniref:Uncharacterized protein LOC110985056 n=1 Tax=Acanthaster planci TaxID=133434 RepID=A0A8B7Z751_ACAPL|nr:uncharacterized protein LOC110985056 [Acanthaster planci]
MGRQFLSWWCLPALFPLLVLVTRSLAQSWPSHDGGFPPLQPEPSPPVDVTTVAIANTTVGLCNDQHFCSSLGCGPSRGVTGDGMVPLCHCDQACFFYDDCCHDYVRTCEEPESPSSGTKDYRELELDHFSCVFFAKYRQTTSFLLVSTCPDEATDTQAAILCEDPGIDDALGSIPCYSNKSGVHFRNVYCALCHGVNREELIPWDVLVDCALAPRQYDVAKALLQSSVKNFDRIEQELGCAVIIQTPALDDVRQKPRACYLDVIGHCATPQDPLSSVCESYTALVTVAGRESTEVFRNPHCALCNLPNEPDRVEFATDCSGSNVPVFYLSGTFLTLGAVPWGAESEVEIKSFNRPVSPPPISILFDFRADSSVKIIQDREVLVSETVQCPQNEVYDPFVSRCRRLTCPKGYLLHDNKCVPDFKAIGEACEDSRGDSRIDIGVTVTLGDPCKDSLPNDRDAHLVKDIRLCVEDFLGFPQGSLQIATNTPKQTTACRGGTLYAFSTNITNEPFKNFQEALQLSLPAANFCRMFDIYDTWSLELHQHCKDLSTDECNGRWLNDTEFSLPVKNGRTLVYVNASASWYQLNQTIIKTNFQTQKKSVEQSTHMQICADSTLACPLVVLNTSLFVVDKNDPGSIIHNHTGKVFKRDEYVRTESGKIQVCSFYDSNGTRSRTGSTFFVFSMTQQILSLVGNIISMTAALATFITYCAFKELRQRISLAIMSLVACLFLAQLLLLVSGSATSNPPACTTVAVLGHFFWLTTVLWTGVLAFDLNQTFAYSSKIRRLDSNKRTYCLHVTFCFGGASLVVLPCLVIHLCDCTDIPLSYGNENVCWIGNGYVNLVAFGIPIGLTVLVNGVLFAFTVHGIRSSTKQSKPLKQTEKSELQRMRQELFVYIKISSLMGFTWIFGFAAAWTDVDTLWYIFIILNSCQGLLVFLAFICNKKVWCLWTNLLCGGREKHGGSSSFSTRLSMRPMLKHRSDSNASSATRKTRTTDI